MKIKLEKRDKLLIVIVVCVALCAFLAHQIIGGDGAGKVTVKVNGELKGGPDDRDQWRHQYPADQKWESRYDRGRLSGSAVC